MSRLVLIFFVFLIVPIYGQKSYELSFVSDDYKIVKKNPEKNFKDSLSVVNYLKEFRQFAIKRGFVLASIDQLVFDTKLCSVDFYVGPKFDDATLTLDPEDALFLKKIGSVNERFLRSIPFTPLEISKALFKIQTDLENNGYPFVQVKLEEIKIDSTTLHAHVKINKGKEVRWTKINLKGDDFVSDRLISSYLQINIGDLYSQQAVQRISSRLKQIQFIEEIKPAELLFTMEGVELFLYLKSKPVSLANGVLGLQPDAVKGTVALTGEVRLKLVNILKRAELIDFDWRSISPQTQALKAQATLPNLFKTPFGIDGHFQLYKRDSTFLELKSTIGIQYALRSGNYLKAFYRNHSSNVLSGGTNNPQFTNLGSVSTNFYGLGIYRQSVDYLPNPRKGFVFSTDISVGSRKSTANDTAQVLTQTTFKGEIQLQWFVPLAKRHVLRLAGFSEFYEAEDIFQNEVYRFGGQISQRGFNEEELFATSRFLGTFEYRFLLDQNSFLFAFYDQSWYENKSINYNRDTPRGIGVGLSFGTNLGTFSISYGIGSQRGNPFLLRDGKVHFGYITYF